MRIRHTARVLLLDPEDRILLWKGRLSGDPRPFWGTIGGEREAGESVLEAAAREIVEETGLTDAELGPIAWTGESLIPFGPGGETLHFKEAYVVAHTRGGPLSDAGWTQDERELLDELRWWSLDELRAADEVVYPIGLSELLPDVLAGRIAATPLLIHTTEGPVRPVPRPYIDGKPA
jgi:8-oxo-dGTP pyrophosphatase MutT (NUDIX family)